MNELLKFINAYFAFLWDTSRAKVVQSMDDGRGALIVFEMGNLRLQFLRDRDEIFVRIQGRNRPLGDPWWCQFGIMRQFITGTLPESDVTGPEQAEFLKANLPKIDDMFSSANAQATERELGRLKEERATRWWGPNVTPPEDQQ